MTTEKDKVSTPHTDDKQLEPCPVCSFHWNMIVIPGETHHRNCPHFDDRDKGCACQGCGQRYKVDVQVPDDLWNRIKPKANTDGAGLLCGRCILTRVEALDEFDAFTLSRLFPASTTSDRIWLDKYGHRLYGDHTLKLQGTEYIRAEGFIAAFKDAAIKVHAGFKHEGPWEECEWVQCEDRRKMIEGTTTSAALTVDNLQRRLYEECVTANWDPERKNTFAEEIAHLHEELSEAFRAWRKYKDCKVREVNGKLEGVPIEFADALIGMFYNAELHGFDLLAAIERKHRFNLTRSYVAEGRQLHAPATVDVDEILGQMRDVPSSAAATAAPIEQSDEQYVVIDGERRRVIPCPDNKPDCEVLHTEPVTIEGVRRCR